MTEPRALRERKKVINYNDDAHEEPRPRRKGDTLDTTRVTRSRVAEAQSDKENRKRKERPAPEEEDEEDEVEEDGEAADGRPPKRTRSPQRRSAAVDDEEDAIEDSDSDANAFISFARPGSKAAPASRPGRPAPKPKGQAAKPAAAPTARASAPRGRRGAGAASAPPGGAGDAASDGDAGRRPTRAAANRANARLCRSVAGAAGKRGGRGSDSMDVDGDSTEDPHEEAEDGSSEEDSGASDVEVAAAAAGRAPRSSSEGEEEGSSSEDGDSEGSEADDEEDEEENEDVPARRSTRGAPACPSGRPTRACVARRSATANAGNQRAKRRRGVGSSSGDDDDSGDSSDSASASESEGDNDEEGSGRGAAAKGGDQSSDVEIISDGDDDKGDRKANHGRAADAADDSGSESDDEGSTSSGSGSEDDASGDGVEGEQAPKRGRGRPRKGPPKAPERTQPGHKGRGKGRGKGAAASAAGRNKEAGGKQKVARSGRGKGKAKGKTEEKAKAADKAKPAAVAAGRSGASGGNKAGSTKGPREPVERILSYDPDTELYHVKLEGVSYRRTEHVTQAYLEKHKQGLLRVFAAREVHIEVEEEWKQVDRVIAVRTLARGRQGASKQVLVKWRGLEYGDATWEWEADMTSAEDKAAIKRFQRHTARAKARASRAAAKRRSPGSDDEEDDSDSDFDGDGGDDAMEVDGGGAAPPPPPPGGLTGRRALRQPDFALPTFCNGRALRDYQQVSVRWMVNNYVQRRNCILGDEMGLGKTAQSISCLETLRSVGGVSGPFLIVAPLSTLGHWQREVQTWTDMNVVLFAGSAADRAVILEHEFFLSSGGGGGSGGSGRRPRPSGDVRFDVLLVSYDTLLKERSLLRSMSWSAAVFDEAHRLKGINSSTRAAVKELDVGWLLLLTGTPIQNNMMELYAILNLLDPDAYPSPESFAGRFGGGPGGPPPTVKQIKDLQSALAPVLLRRMKEDVEELPQKEEVVIWVELTAHQRAYYRALYEGQIGAMLGPGPAGGGRSLPAMRNLAMELRKLCCHPVLCDGLEDDLRAKLAAQREAARAEAQAQAAGPSGEAFASAELELLVRGSGKMVLLHKLLPKLRAEGRRVLIFSQFVIMLNVLEDYCHAAGYPVERIDGSITGRDRQQAIDRFMEGDNNSAFVFLLSTRAGGQGITLTAADTCIIYDSDWNPQNDLQAMARCHRIGQKKEVTVYRLISADTYEMALFSSASRKYGLDEAILGFSAGSDPEADSARIAALLRHGAHGLLKDEAEGAKKGEAFAGEDINQILEGRTEKRQIGSRAGNTFSVATFAIGDAGADDDDDDDALPGGGAAGKRRGGRRQAEEEREYWRGLLPEAVAAHEAKAAEGPVVLGPRKRNKVNYNVDDRRLDPKESDGSDDDEETEAGGEEGGADGAGGAGAAGKKRRRGRRSKRDGSEPAVEGEQEGEGGAAPGAGKAKSHKAQGRAPNLSWKRGEVKALEDKLVSMGPDRWDELFAQLQQPFSRSREEVEAAGRALWELYGTAAALAAERRKKLDAERRRELEALMAAQAAQAAAAEAAAADAAAAPAPADGSAAASAPPVAPPPSAAAEAGASGPAAAAAGAAGSSEAAAAPPAPPAPDEYELKLADAVGKLPESLRTAFTGTAAVKRLLREAGDNLRHATSMAELAALMRPKLQALQAEKEKAEEEGRERREGGGGGSAVPEAAPAQPPAAAPAAAASPLALRAAYVQVTASSQLPAWWGRAYDEVLLLAAAQVGYMPRRPRFTVDVALRLPPLCNKVAPAPEAAEPAADGAPAQAADAGAEEDGQAQRPAAAAAAPQPAADGGAAASAPAAGGAAAVAAAAAAGAAGGDRAMADAAAAREAAAATGEGPQLYAPTEWQALLKALSRRVSRVVTATLDLHRRQMPGSRPGRPSGPPPLALEPSRDALHSGRPTAAAAAAAPAPAQAHADAGKGTSAAPATNNKQSPPEPEGPQARAPASSAPPSARAPGAAGTSQAAAAAAPGAPTLQGAAAAAKPQSTAGDPGAGSGGQPSKPAAATSAAPAAKHAKKQSTLPFARLSKGSGSAPPPAKASAPQAAEAAAGPAAAPSSARGAVAADGQRLSPDGTDSRTAAKAAAAKAPAARCGATPAARAVGGVIGRGEPGSAERPIEIVD